MRALTFVATAIIGCLLLTTAAAQSAQQPSCTEDSAASVNQVMHYVRDNHRFQAWVLARSVGRCFGERSLAEVGDGHYEKMYLAGMFCVLAFDAGQDEARLAASDTGALLLINDLVYGATFLQSVADDVRAPEELRSRAVAILHRLVIRHPQQAAAQSAGLGEGAWRLR